MTGSRMRRSECITAVMVLPAAEAGDVQPADSAKTEAARPKAIPGSVRREVCDIRSSPDVKLVKARSWIMHVVRYLCGLTCWKTWIFETCIKRLARQSAIWTNRLRPNCPFTNPARIILVSILDDAACQG